MTIEYFIKKAGDPVAPSKDVEGMAIAMDYSAPDVIRLPRDLGGHIEAVTGWGMAQCPCGEHEAWTLKTKSHLLVAECGSRFLWYKECQKAE